MGYGRGLGRGVGVGKSLGIYSPFARGNLVVGVLFLSGRLVYCICYCCGSWTLCPYSLVSAVLESDHWAYYCACSLSGPGAVTRVPHISHLKVSFQGANVFFLWKEF